MSDCRECRAGLSQAMNAAIVYYCPEHGVQQYDPSARSDLDRAVLDAADAWERHGYNSSEYSNRLAEAVRKRREAGNG